MICYFCGERFGIVQTLSDCPGVCSKEECNVKCDDEKLWIDFMAVKKGFIDKIKNKPADATLQTEKV